MSAGLLLEETLIKRSQQKKRTSPLNYKERLFVLTESQLAYYDGRREFQRGSIELRRIRCAEIVKHGGGIMPCQNKYPFQKHFGRECSKCSFSTSFACVQVVYDNNTLYVFAPNPDSRSLWVQSLKGEIKDNAVVSAKFHPQFWQEGAWLCCRQAEKLAPGCEEYNLFADSKKPAFSRKPLPPIPEDERNKKRPPPPLPPGDDEEEQQEEEEEEVVVALYDFPGTEPHDLSLVKGGEYVILDKCDANWYKDKEGAFVVRDSSTPGAFTVSLYTKSGAGSGVACIKHYHIKETLTSPPQFYLAEKHLFSSVPELIEYHKHNAAGLVARLRYPVGKQDKSAPSTAGFSYEKWEINPSELTFMKELGSGQFGVVRLGKWRAQHRVAIKAIRAGAMYEEDFIEEAKVMMRLSHPKLVQLYGVCSQQKPIYIVTEFMEHGCLLNFLRQRRGSFGLGSLLSICLDICEAMEHLEAHRFIHRDLASRNCLVNDSLVVKVSDFGMTRYVLDDQYTSSSGAKFPVKWSPPEVFNFCKYSSKSDVWSYGVLMWEVFTEGRMPFEQSQNHEVVTMVTKGQRLHRPKMAPLAIYDIMQLTWQERPDDRPSFSQLCPMISDALESDTPPPN
uniref:Tyrosine-protein kinase n=1 Tax=Gasterosteus aculeatus aculeatus TaxID=481459 RepID=A0AAQ4PHR4_GASAC